MIRHTRGDVITFGPVEFFDITGALASEPAVNVTIVYPSSVPTGAILSHDPGQLKGKAVLPLSVDVTGKIWSTTWDTSVSDPGTVFWSIRSSPAAIAQDGSFVLAGNLANFET